MNEADARLYVLNGAPVQPRGGYVLYWCRAYRRARDNRALDHAARRANELRLPLVTYEALDVRYPHANDRLHTFVLEGASEMRAEIEARGSAYLFYLPRTHTEASRSHALARLAARAALVVTDWYPPAGGAHSLWAHTPRTASKLACRVEAYDDAVVVPMGPLAHKHEIAARTIRPKVRALLDAALHRSHDVAVRARPLRELEPPFEPTDVTRAAIPQLVARCAIDHGVAPVAHTPGGAREANRRLAHFVAHGLAHYADARNDLARTVSSGLSPHLHFGHVSARAVALAAMHADAPEPAREAFVEELAVRRALAFNHALTEPAHAEYASVPAWARATLDAHRDDPRAAHSLAEWEAARTREPLWNAAQRELVRDGTIHPYARMLWGKVAITLAAKPEEAFAWLAHLNDKYALDGRDPNSYTNIAWCFGLHDHPFPTRAVFGQVRSMTTRSAAQKWDVDAYVRRVDRDARA